VRYYNATREQRLIVPSVPEERKSELLILILFPQRSNFVAELPAISENSKNYFLVSNRYFWAGEAGPVTLLKHEETFQTSRLVGSVDITIQAPEFSFCGWLLLPSFFFWSWVNELNSL